MMNFIRRIAINAATFISKTFGSWHVPFTHKKLGSKHYRSLKKAVRPGIILISKTNGELSNLLIPGFWGHAAIVLDGNTVVEAIGAGVVKTDLLDFVFKKDYICALYPVGAGPEDMSRAASMAESFCGLPYDFNFNSGDIQAFYCSELIYHVYSKSMPMFELPTILGVKTISPSDFHKRKSEFISIWLSDLA